MPSHFTGGKYRKLKMSSDLLLGTFGDISKVQHQIETVVNNNCVTKCCDTPTIAQLEEPTSKSSSGQINKVQEIDANTSDVAKRKLYKCGKLERAKMLAEGYTTGLYFYVFFVCC